MVGLGIAVPIIAGYIAKFAGVQSLTDVFSAIRLVCGGGYQFSDLTSECRY
jgi:predicted metal-binding membrane protein